jgi:hypothetical protein
MTGQRRRVQLLHRPHRQRRMDLPNLGLVEEVGVEVFAGTSRPNLVAGERPLFQG